MSAATILVEQINGNTGRNAITIKATLVQANKQDGIRMETMLKHKSLLVSNIGLKGFSKHMNATVTMALLFCCYLTALAA